MSTLTLRLVKGSALTYQEADDNFSNLNSDKLENVVEDTTPQLGGNLDVNGNSIVSVSNGDINLTPNGTGLVKVGTNLQIQAQGDLRLADGDSSNYVALQAPSTVASNVTFTLPSADGTANQVLKTDGSGALSFTTISSGITDVVQDTTPQLGGNLDVNGNSIVSASNGNITLAPNGTGKVVISGDLQVDGTTTTINSTTLDVDDINITLAKGAANAAAANGGGITLEGPTTAATITYASADDSWNLNKLTKVTGNLSVSGDIIAPTGGNGDLTLAGDGTGNVNLNSDTVRIGDNNANATLTTHGTGDLILNTNEGTSSGSITIFDGANGNIALTPNGTGSVVLDGINYPQADGSNGQVLTTNGTGTLSFTTITPGISGVTLTDDTSTNATRYVLFDDSTSGSQTAFNVSSTKLTFNPSTGTLTATTFSGALSGNASTATSAATLTTARAIYGNNFDGSAALTQVIASTYGGTGNGFAKFSGPTTSEKTFTLPNSSATLLYDTGPLGTPSSGTVTNLTGTASININGTVGATTANTGAFTTLSASSTVSGTGFSTYLASPPAIGGTAAAAGTFTTLTVNAANDLRLADSDSSNYVGFKAPATVSANNVWTLPSADGTNGQVLTTNGSGTLSWSSASGLTDIVNDTTPQLGGNLDVQSNSITTSVVNGDITIAPNGSGNVILDTDSIEFGDGTSTPVIQSRNATTPGITLRSEGTFQSTIAIVGGNNGNIELTPHGTGDVVLAADSVVIGDVNSNATLTTSGTGNLTLSTGNGVNTGTILITQGTNGDIIITPNGTGDVDLVTDNVQIGDANANATLTTNGTGDLILNTNNGTNSGSITIQDAANGNIILAPNGTGRVEISGTSSNAGGINFYEDTDNGTNKALLTAPAALGADITLTLPSTTATLGYLNLPAVGTKTGSYTLATGDVGKYVQVGSGGSITIPDATFAEGDAIVICNNHSAAITITCTITTAYIAGTDSDKASVSLATRGVANILFLSSTVCVISGNVS